MNAGVSDKETFVPLLFKRHGFRQVADLGTPAHDPRIIVGVARAMYWQELLESGKYKSDADIARGEGLDPSTVNRLLRLALLAPDIVAQVVAGRQPRRLTLQWLLRNPLPNDWTAQRQIIREFE